MRTEIEPQTRGPDMIGTYIHASKFLLAARHNSVHVGTYAYMCICVYVYPHMYVCMYTYTKNAITCSYTYTYLRIDKQRDRLTDR